MEARADFGEGAVLIAGPTASGKSALALVLAERLGGMVVNADSMQVYRELRILTARPDRADEARVPHRLYGHVGAAEAYSVGRWLEDIRAVLDEGRPAIIAGGTGLYFRALTQGLVEIPPIPEEVRARWRERAAAIGGAALHAELAQRDPEMAARLKPTDPQRVTRALEVFDATGRSLSAWRVENAPPLIGPGTPRFVFDLPRAALYARIDARAADMVAAGGVEEARALLALNLDPALPAMKSLGAPEMGAVAKGEISREEGLAAFAMNTRRYAKRQATWFRHQAADWPRITTLDPDEAVETVLKQIRRSRP